MTDLAKVGRVAGKAMIYFLAFSTLALLVGLVVANVVQPGAGMVAIVFIQYFDSPLPQLDYFADIFVTIDRATKRIKRLVVTPGDGRVSIRAR